MKNWILGAVMLISQFSFSQITINSSHMPVAGDTLRFSTALLDTAILLNYQNSGANLTWNFDSLRVISQTVQEFVSSSQTPYNAGPNRIGLLFADTLRFGAAEIYDAFNFLNNTSSDFSIDYRGTTAPNPIPFLPNLLLEGPYSDKDEVFQFPLNYLDRDSSTFNFTFNNPLLGIYYQSSGYRINDVDAWGTVTTPFGTFSTIRVVTDMVSLDTISALGQNFAIPSHIREYQWISDQERIPVMKVNGTVIAGAFIPTTVEFRDSFRIVEPLFPTIALFNADTTVVGVNETLEFNNFSTGSTSFQWEFTPNTVNYVIGSATDRDISVSFQNPGDYSVRLIASGGTRSDTLDRVDYITVQGPLPTANFQVESDTIPLNQNFTVYNTSQGGDSFLWGISPISFKFEPGSDFTSPDSIVVQFSDTGYFEIRLIASNSNGADTLINSRAVFVEVPVGLNEINESTNFFEVFPNPVQRGESFKIGPFYGENSINYQIFSLEGKLIQSASSRIQNSFLKIDQELTAGSYFILLEHKLGVEIEQLIVK